MGVAWCRVWPRTVPDSRRWPVWVRLRNTRSTTLYPIVPYNQEGTLGISQNYLPKVCLREHRTQVSQLHPGLERMESLILALK